jgi:glycosyltransferase involved in cell wall biosynthesis
MRIVMAANWWYRRGGLTSVMMDEAAGLERRGHEVIPFAAAHADNVPTPFSDHFPPFFETADAGRQLGPGRRAAAMMDLIHNRSAGHRFAALLDRTRPDVVHLHNPARQLSPSVIGAARARRIPVVLTLHDMAIVCPQGQMWKGGRVACTPPNCVRGVVVHAITNRCVKGSVSVSSVAALEHLVHRATGAYTRRPAILIAPSLFVADLVASAGIARRRIRYLPNGIEPGPEPGPLPIRGAGHVLFAGRLVPEKGLSTLVEAARTNPDIPFVVAGDGPAAEGLRASAPTNLTVAGHRSGQELAALRDHAVAVVAPSLWYENAPLSVLEAMGAGRPVVASRLGGHPELLEGGTGLLFEPGDARGLAAAIRRLWMDRDEAAAMGRAGRAAVLARFDLSGHVEALLGLYAEVTASPRSTGTVASR